MRARPLPLAAGVVALALAACGQSRLDADEVERELQQRVEENVGERVNSVDCPDDVPRRPGATFSCKVFTSGGEVDEVPVRVRDNQGNISPRLPPAQ